MCIVALYYFLGNDKLWLVCDGNGRLIRIRAVAQVEGIVCLAPLWLSAVLYSNILFDFVLRVTFEYYLCGRLKCILDLNFFYNDNKLANESNDRTETVCFLNRFSRTPTFFCTITPAEFQKSSPSLPLPPDHVLNSGAVTFPGKRNVLGLFL